MILFRFQIKDEIKAARIEATKRITSYVEESKTSQRRRRIDLELESKFLRSEGDYIIDPGGISQEHNQPVNAESNAR